MPPMVNFLSKKEECILTFQLGHPIVIIRYHLLSKFQLLNMLCDGFKIFNEIV